MNKTYKAKELSEVCTITRDINFSLDKSMDKLSKIKSLGKESDNSIRVLNNNLRKLMSEMGRVIGKSMIGGQNNNTDGIVAMLPKIIGSMISGARASGGPVNSKQAYIVGERGPELFVPSNNGHIVANHQLASNKPAINLVMNINTANADSFRKSQSQIMQEAMMVLNRANRSL